MLAVISDLHLSDGTTCATIAPGAFEIFAQRLADTAEPGEHADSHAGGTAWTMTSRSAAIFRKT